MNGALQSTLRLSSAIPVMGKPCVPLPRHSSRSSTSSKPNQPAQKKQSEQCALHRRQAEVDPGAAA